MDKLTTKSQEALAQAIGFATEAGNPQVEPLHLLNALLQQSGGVAAALLDAMGVNRAGIAERVNAALAALPGASGSSVNQPQASRPLSRVITDAGKEATALGDSYISTEHLLLAIADSQSQAGESCARPGQPVSNSPPCSPTVRGRAQRWTTRTRRGPSRLWRSMAGPDPAGPRGQDGPGDRPRRGRSAASSRCCPRTENNPVLIGEPGVGKTAVVEGLAQRMVDGGDPRVPARQAPHPTRCGLDGRRCEVPR